MKSFISYTLAFLLVIFLLSGAYLTFYGYETARFNRMIAKELEKKDPNAYIKLEKIKIKLDLKNLNLFLKVKQPKLKYQNINIPFEDVKLYYKLLSLIKAKPELNKLILNFNKFEINEIQKIAVIIKPSNFKSYLLNNIKNGNVAKSTVELTFFPSLKVKSYKFNGRVEKTNIKIKEKVNLNNINFNFVVDEKFFLINAIAANFKNIKITEGKINVNRKNQLFIKGSFKSHINIDSISNIKNLIPYSIPSNINNIKLKGEFLNKFDLKLSDSLEILDYNYLLDGSILNSKLNLKNFFKSNIFNHSFDKMFTKKSVLKINLNKKKKNSLTLGGLYSFDNINFKNFVLKNNLKKNNNEYYVDFDFKKKFSVDVLNFTSDPKKVSNVKSKFNFSKNKIFIKEFIFKEGKNKIDIKNLRIKNNKLEKFDNINILTFTNDVKNNNFKISLKDKIYIKGHTYDSTLLVKLLKSNTKSNFLNNINKKIEIKFENVMTRSFLPLKKFNLLGIIEKGQFIKINSKSEYAENKYLDISLSKNKDGKKKLEIFTDSPKLLLADFKSFDGINDGKLLFTSVIEKSKSKSKLLIEDFKILKAPTFATLLTLADLSGVADLLSGEGISFDSLEIILEEDPQTIKIQEVLAMGPSISILMNGYFEKNTELISLSGTMVPAKNLNKLISKIPLVGRILVGKQMGEGIFGVSFKVKGPLGKVKTSVNPIKTLTPRFITRILEKKTK